MLSILSVAYPLAPVGPDAVGGAEVILGALDRALVAAGHRSVVVAQEGSTCAGELRPTAPVTRPLDTGAFYTCHASCRTQIARALKECAVDAIHMHGVDFFRYIPDVEGVPILATLHLWPDAYPRALFGGWRPNLHLQCVSESQRRACPRGTNAFVIRNGVDLDAYGPSPDRSENVVVLGRVCPEKGVHLAIDAAVDANVPLVIAGTVFAYDAHEQYFHTAIAPRLGDLVQFVGCVTGAAKRRMLATARCLLLPSVVPETSSLAAMEALASGTPVVALRSPALEELIEHGVTGWLVDRPSNLGPALRRVGELSREACRAAAEARCSRDRMTSEYLACYERIAGRGRATRSAHVAAPTTVAF